MDRSSFLKTLASSSAMLLGQPLYLSGCAPERYTPKVMPRLVLLYAPCSVNKFYLSPYNPQVTYTPAIERFASEASVFMKHQAESGQSGVAYASIVTGSQADIHGVFSHPRPLQKSLYTITDAFAENGYDVHFWAQQIMANYSLGY